MPSAGYLVATALVFLIWYRVEGTLSFASITTRRGEGFYWSAVLATFVLGTAVGDLTAAPTTSHPEPTLDEFTRPAE